MQLNSAKAAYKTMLARETRAICPTAYRPLFSRRQAAYNRCDINPTGFAMNLQLHLLSRIVLAALISLLLTAGWVLQQQDRQARAATLGSADNLARQLELQLLRIDAGLSLNRSFPDFEVWKQSGNNIGICVALTAAETGSAHSVCNGAKFSAGDWPAGFESLYRRFFNPGLAASRPVVYQGRNYGLLSVTPSAEMQIGQAWDNLRGLAELSALTICSVCLLVYAGISRALRPARFIVAGLEKLGRGELAYRLPCFELREWRLTASAINQLAASQQQLLEERQQLLVKLMTIQEQERHFLARELHDEFGQCLTAVNALAASVKLTAGERCPELVTEAEQIGRIAGQMLDEVRGLLQRLRPAELDELGLAASLNSLVRSWNAHGGKTRFRLQICGDCGRMPEAASIALFRVAQEGLTNIGKHAEAGQAELRLQVEPGQIVLTIEDDGKAESLPFTGHEGIGLLGIRERVTALAGSLALSIVQPHGLRLEARIPLSANKESRP